MLTGGLVHDDRPGGACYAAEGPACGRFWGRARRTVEEGDEDVDDAGRIGPREADALPVRVKRMMLKLDLFVMRTGMDTGRM